MSESVFMGVIFHVRMINSIKLPVVNRCESVKLCP